MALSNPIPMRWPSGPLDVAILQKKESVTAQARQTLEYWHSAAALDILQGSPVNCLVVSWASGLAEDAEQQRTIRPLVDAARQRKLDVIGWVDGKTDGKAAIAAAEAAGLSAVAIQGFSGKSEFPVIPWGDRAHAPWDTTAPVLPITDSVWPGVASRRGTAVIAAPTGLPWLDSNGWHIKLARACTQAQVWVLFDPPGKGEVVPARSYPVAICDAEGAGGRWVISLDLALRASLAAKDATAVATWKSISDTVSFFEKHRDWRSYRPAGVVGVISDFAGNNYDFSSELLNLLSRYDLVFRALVNSARSSLDLTGLKAAIWADSSQPTAQQRKGLLSFVEQGGLLLTGSKWGSEGRSVVNAHPRFDVRTLGKGRVAVAKDGASDPYQFTVDTQELLSHRNDVAKIFNGNASGGIHYSASSDGKRALLQLLSYSTYGRSTNNATAWTRDKYKSARLWTIEAAQAVPVNVAACEDGGTEYHLPPIPSYLALELEI